MVYLQVHARPRIQAEHMEGRKWVLEGEAEPKVIVWGTCLEINLHWYQQLTFHDGEVYSWKKVCPRFTMAHQHPGSLVTTSDVEFKILKPSFHAYNAVRLCHRKKRWGHTHMLITAGIYVISKVLMHRPRPTKRASSPSLVKRPALRQSLWMEAIR
jgi:Oxysterol-binding protein